MLLSPDDREANMLSGLDKTAIAKYKRDDRKLIELY